ncbi:MAG: hypothetical protein DLM68_12090 [Hyphomicrobiales bacterium]|nr:MAG: hypothetical protein DLM68_12090 [Hyphomicrobiales bacterium]
MLSGKAGLNRNRVIQGKRENRRIARFLLFCKCSMALVGEDKTGFRILRTKIAALPSRGFCQTCSLYTNLLRVAPFVTQVSR